MNQDFNPRAVHFAKKANEIFKTTGDKERGRKKLLKKCAKALSKNLGKAQLLKVRKGKKVNVDEKFFKIVVLKLSKIKRFNEC